MTRIKNGQRLMGGWSFAFAFRCAAKDGHQKEPGFSEILLRVPALMLPEERDEATARRCYTYCVALNR